jgi:hypothetical protein
VSGAVSSWRGPSLGRLHRPTLVVGRAARATKGRVAAHVCSSRSMSVAVAHTPARHRHGPVAVRAGHGAVGGVVSQVARGAARDMRCARGEACSCA